MTRSFLHAMIHPKSIAIVGASNNPMKMGTMHALSILKDGFSGKFYPVHPREKTILGHPAYPSAADLPETPDLAIFVLPARNLMSVFEDFGRLGTPYAIIITAGFKETGEDGRKQEQRLKALARKYNIRFIGPNCMGIINRDISLNTSVAPIIDKPGSLGLISQSGTYVAQTVAYLEKRGVRLSKAFSMGNEADVNIIDVLEYLGEDEKTTAISMYVEAIRDVKRFLDVAKKITPHKPVLVQYVGGSEAGGRAGSSHTGAMAGQNHLYDGLFRQAGVIRVYSVEELYLLGWTLATQPPIAGNRIGIITNSGGPGSAIADTLEANGCVVPPFTESLREKIRPLLEPHAPCGNPVDLTFTMDMASMTETIPDMIMKSGEVDGIVLHGAMSTGFMGLIYPHIADLLPGMTFDDLKRQSEQDISGATRLPSANGIPMTVSSFFGREDHYTKSYEDSHVPVLDAPEKAARAMAALVRYAAVRRRAQRPEAVLPAKSEKAAQIIKEAEKQGLHTLDEYAAKQVLKAYGIPVPEERLAESSQAAAEAARSLSFPVAVKACHPDILHKTEQGLVALNIAGQDDVIEAFHTICERAGRPVPVLISEMAPGQREFLAGITHDELFGYCIAFGTGGILTEALADITYRVAPIVLPDAEEMMDELKSKTLLEPCRGMPAADKHALADLLCTLSAIAFLHPEIREIDINPIIIGAGGKPVAVDALVALK